MSALRALIADDDRLSRILAKGLLTKWGFEIIEADDGNQAWEILQNDPTITIALLDWMMDGFTGLELASKIHAELSDRFIYIIMVSAKGEKKDIIMGLESGAHDYIPKPYDPIELLARINVAKRMTDKELILRKQRIQLQTYADEMETVAEQRAKMLVHADRLATIGTLTAGVAHEINNPTTFISGNIQFLIKCWPDLEKAMTFYLKENKNNKVKLLSEEGLDVLNGIQEGVIRITDIVSGLKSFARQGVDADSMTAISIAECMERALKFCHNRLKHSVNVTNTIPSDLPLILGNSQKLEQVFVNLLVNAADAMEGMDEQNILLASKHTKDKVTISIRDMGHGIDEKKLEKIWNPFFTTKEVGKGTGLGLSIIKNIIESHKGTIDVHNHPDGGAEFTIKLIIPRRRNDSIHANS